MRDFKMLKLFTFIIPFIVFIWSDGVWAQDITAVQDTTTRASVITPQDSLSSESQTLPPLMLGSPGDTVSRPSSLLPVDRPWMAEPDTFSFARSPDLLFEIPQTFFPDHETPPFQRESWLLQSRANLMTPWRLQMQSSEKYRIWRTIFGSIQAGGVAYLMYLHFKKHGLK